MPTCTVYVGLAQARPNYTGFSASWPGRTGAPVTKVKIKSLGLSLRWVNGLGDA